MDRTVFFSWQTDRPPREGRNLIEKALGSALSAIAKDTTVEPAVRQGLSVDKDTMGVPGSPPIFSTILAKIDRATVFVPDLTFVGARPDGRPTPNPNVLIEYGWALKALGHGRMVPVMNEAYGSPRSESMPFDLASLRFPITYNVPDAGSDEMRSTQREQLTKIFETALRAVLESDQVSSNIQNRIAEFIRTGYGLRDEWTKRLGSTEQVQRQIALAVQEWHNTVEDYIRTLPRGTIYLLRFQNRQVIFGGYPVGINMNVAGNWDLLKNDLGRLNEFLVDPDLGKP